MIPNPATLALDFDGVICDGMQEYFQTSCRAYGELWPADPLRITPELAQAFAQLRPLVTHGWEMPVVVRGLVEEYPLAALINTWPTIRDRILAESHYGAAELGQTVDRVRDRWIETDWQEWLGLHQFYPGVVAQLQAWGAQNFPWVIITTKETRFVTYLLDQAQVSPPPHGINGKDCGQPKVQVLQSLTHHAPLWFVEDRLEALQAVQKVPELDDVTLFLADWGYTTAATRTTAAQDPRIQLLSLAQFAQPFPAWFGAAPV